MKSNGACEFKKKKGGPLAMLNEREARFGTRHFTHGIQSQENPCICTGGSPACLRCITSTTVWPHTPARLHIPVALNLSVDM